MNHVYRANLSGGLIGWVFTSPKRAIEIQLRQADDDGQEVIRVMDDRGNLLQSLVYAAICVCTLFIWCPAPGKLIITRPRHQGRPRLRSVPPPAATEAVVAPSVGTIADDGADDGPPKAVLIGGAVALLALATGALFMLTPGDGGHGPEDADLAMHAVGDSTAVEDEEQEGTGRIEAPPLASGTIEEVALAWRDGLRRNPQMRGARIRAHSDIHYELVTEGGDLTPMLVRSGPALNIRVEPSAKGTYVRTMAPGTVAVALYGNVDGRRSEAGGKGTWTYLVASGSTVGWSASSLLDQGADCVPTMDAWLPHVPKEARVAVGRDAMVALADATLEGHLANTATWVGHDPANDRAYVAVDTLDAHCNATHTQVYSVAGRVEHSMVVDAAKGGPALLAIGHKAQDRPEAATRWEVYELGKQVPAWSMDLRTDPRIHGPSDGFGGPYTRGPRNKPGYWPFRVQKPKRVKEFYRWDGGTLTRDR